MAMVANLLKVKVYPKDLKSIPDVLPFRDLLDGEPMELELNKKEIWRCMYFADVFDLSSGEEVLIDRPAFNEIVEFVEEDGEGSEDEPEEGGNGEPDDEPSAVEQALENSEKGVNPALVNKAKVTRE